VRVDRIIAEARGVADYLAAAGKPAAARAVRDLATSRACSRSLNSSLHADLAVMRTLVIRAVDVMSRTDEAPITDAEWDALIADMTRALAHSFPGKHMGDK